MEPFWWVRDGDTMQTVAVSGDSPSCMYIITALCGVIVTLAGIIWKDMQDDKKEAKDREASLNVMLANALKKSRGEDS